MKEQDEIKSRYPEWREIGSIIAIPVIGFVASLFFCVSLSDICGYIEDNNYEFPVIQYLAIFLFLILFYVVPRILIGSFNKLFPQKRCNSRNIYYLLSMLTVSAFIILIIMFLLPMYVPLHGSEAVALRWTVLLWFLSILFINILLNADALHTVIGIVCSKFKEISGFSKDKTP